MTGRGPGQNPTLRGRRLAMELQRRREATGMSREEVARQLEWSTSTLFRIETGRSRPQPGNVRTLLELYGVTGAERDGLIQLTREARQPGWWHSFRDVLPNPYEVYIGLETDPALPDLAGCQGCRVRQYRDENHGHEPSWRISQPGMGGTACARLTEEGFKVPVRPAIEAERTRYKPCSRRPC
jgi:transcriptional regulator with XRE-family HTH domain